MFARTLLTVLGLACGSAAALLFLPVAVIFDPLVQSATSHVPADHWFGLLETLLTDEDPEETVATLIQLVWTIGMLVCVIPVTITALIGGVARSRSFLFHAGFTGLLAAAMPWILRASRFAERGGEMSASEAHLTLILFLTGAVAGTIYSLIAARAAPKPYRDGWLSAPPNG